LEASTVLSRRSRQSPASNFLAARIGAFEASWCYAKITPAALRRGKFDRRRREGAEGLGCNPEFESNDFRPHLACAAARALAASLMAAS